MTDTIKLKDVKAENINDKINDQIYIDTSNNKGLNIYQTKVNILGSKSFSESNPIYNGSGQELQFSIPTNGQTLSTQNSGVDYTMKFCFRLPNTSSYYGKIVLTSMGWWLIPCTVDASNRLIEDQSKVKQFICGSCGGSYGIFESSQVQYGSVNQKDELLHIRNNLIQSTLTQEYVNANNTTFFDTTNRIMTITHYPYVMTNGVKVYTTDAWSSTGTQEGGNLVSAKSNFTTHTSGTNENLNYVESGTNGATSDYIEHIVYKQFKCPISLVNQVFDADDNVFYMQALNQNAVRLTLKLQPYYMSEIFGCSQLLDREKTGITDIYLNLYSSSSEEVQGMVLNKEKYCVPFLRYVQSVQMINDPSVPVNDQLINGFTSLSSVFLCLYRQDQGQSQTDQLATGKTVEAESNYIHGRMTLFDPSQLKNIYNNYYDQDDSFVFFNQLQINRGSTTYKLFSDKMDSVLDMLNETNRSINFNNNKTEGKLECYGSQLQTMMKYAYVLFTFDNNSLIDGPSSVCYDGYDSNENKVNYSYRLSYYDSNNGVNPNETVYNASSVPPKCKITDSNYSLLAIQNYDEVMIVNTKNHTIQISEKPAAELVK